MRVDYSFYNEMYEWIRATMLNQSTTQPPDDDTERPPIIKRVTGDGFGQFYESVESWVALAGYL